MYSLVGKPPPPNETIIWQPGHVKIDNQCGVDGFWELFTVLLWPKVPKSFIFNVHAIWSNFSETQHDGVFLYLNSIMEITQYYILLIDRCLMKIQTAGCKWDHPSRESISFTSRYNSIASNHNRSDGDIIFIWQYSSSNRNGYSCCSWSLVVSVDRLNQSFTAGLSSRRCVDFHKTFPLHFYFLLGSYLFSTRPHAAPLSSSLSPYWWLFISPSHIPPRLRVHWTRLGLIPPSVPWIMEVWIVVHAYYFDSCLSYSLNV